MEDDLEAAAAAKKEIEAAASAASANLTGVTESKAKEYAAIFVSITPPKKEKDIIEFITIQKINTTPRATSRKPGNLLLSWRKLFDVGPDIGMAGAGAAGLAFAPMVSAVIVGLYIANKLLSASKEEFGETEALVLVALWNGRDGKDMISEESGLLKANGLRTEYALPVLTDRQFAGTIDRLCEVGCISLKGGVIHIKEKVNIKY